MLKKLKTKISIFFDYVKDICLFIILLAFIIIFLLAIIHNVLKIVQLSEVYSGEYKNIVQTQNGDILNIYQVGNGEKTIVILPGFGIQSPVVMYKNISEGLKQNYRIVIIEYPGYGFAKNYETERTNENIVNDIKDALEISKIDGPYILLPHSISNIYAMKFTKMYPELVQGIISLDGEYPEIINQNEGRDIVKSTVQNIKIASVVEYTGFNRILSYIKPEMYGIDLMKTDKFLNKSDIDLYRKMIATNYLTKSMVNEIENLERNLLELKEYKYPENLPVLQILATDTVKEYDKIYGKNSLNKFAENVMTNTRNTKSDLCRRNTYVKFIKF